MGDAEGRALGAAGQSLSYRDAEVVGLALSGTAVEHSAGLWVGEHHSRARMGLGLYFLLEHPVGQKRRGRSPWLCQGQPLDGAQVVSF